MMTQVFVAACVGITVGWIGFGWVLAEAPGEHVVVASLQNAHNTMQIGALAEPNLRS
jgi:hypothetical protein